MASKYWIKLYHEILDDHKMGRLPDRLWRRVIELFLLAGEQDDEGLLPCFEDIAWRLHLTDEELRDDLGALEEIGIIFSQGEDHVVTKFSDRQGPMTNSERGRRFRETQQKQEYNETHYADERTENEERTDRSQIRLDKIRRDKEEDKKRKEPEKTPNDPLEAYFLQLTNLVKPSEDLEPHQAMRWEKALTVWRDLGATKDDIQSAVDESDDNGLTLVSTASITSFIKSAIARRKRGVRAIPGKHETVEEMMARVKLEEAAMNGWEVVDG